MHDDLPSPEEVLKNFQGVARLFPLPNLVMFPHVLQPLHIFEPRYRDMVRDALATDRLIAMALLKPGSGSQSIGTAPIFPVACLGQIIADELLDDGRYNLLLRGLRRVQILTELPGATAFRAARVELMEEWAPDITPAELQATRESLLTAFRRWLPDDSKIAAQLLADRLDPSMPLGALVDVISYTVHLNLLGKQKLLEEIDVRKRADFLHQLLELPPPPGSRQGHVPPFPPEFSEN